MHFCRPGVHECMGARYKTFSTMIRVRLHVLFFPFRDKNLETATARERQAQ
jgi:hypothetical protein